MWELEHDDLTNAVYEAFPINANVTSNEETSDQSTSRLVTVIFRDGLRILEIRCNRQNG